MILTGLRVLYVNAGNEKRIEETHEKMEPNTLSLALYT